MERTVYQILADRLRRERKEAGRSLESLGELAGLSAAYLSHIEAGRKRPTLDAVERIARALDLSLGELLRDSTIVRDAPEPDGPLVEQFRRLIRGVPAAKKRRVLDAVRIIAELAGK